MTDKDYYVRFTVQEEKGGLKGTHSSFVSNVDVYVNPTESRTIPITSRGTTDLDGIIDANLQPFFDNAKYTSQVVDNNGVPLVVDGVFLNISDNNPIKLIQKDVERAGEFVDRIKQIEEQTGVKFY